MPAKPLLRHLQVLARAAILVAGLAHAASPTAPPAADGPQAHVLSRSAWTPAPLPLEPQALRELQRRVEGAVHAARIRGCALLDAQGGTGRQLVAWLLPNVPVAAWCPPRRG